MITEKFKNDPPELKMEASAKPAFDICSAALDDFYAGKYDANPFLLMLYDEGRMPFSTRVPRDSFVAFIREALARFQFAGTFEFYIFIIQNVFGGGSQVLFSVPSPGKLEMTVNAANTLDFNFAVKEFISGEFVESTIVDSDGAEIIFTGIAGIDSQYELEQLFAELIPGGIVPAITLTFFTLYDFITDDGGVAQMITSDGDSIVFIET